MPSQVSVTSTSGTVYRSSSVDGYETSFPNTSCISWEKPPVAAAAVIALPLTSTAAAISTAGIRPIFQCGA